MTIKMIIKKINNLNLLNNNENIENDIEKCILNITTYNSKSLTILNYINNFLINYKFILLILIIILLYLKRYYIL